MMIIQFLAYNITYRPDKIVQELDDSILVEELSVLKYVQVQSREHKETISIQEIKR